MIGEILGECIYTENYKQITSIDKYNANEIYTALQVSLTVFMFTEIETVSSSRCPACSQPVHSGWDLTHRMYT